MSKESKSTENNSTIIRTQRYTYQNLLTHKQVTSLNRNTLLQQLRHVSIT